MAASSFGLSSRPIRKTARSGLSKGKGVDPDIVVDNDPAKEFKGEDQQLDRAIQEIQDRTENQTLRSAAGPALSKPRIHQNRN